MWHVTRYTQGVVNIVSKFQVRSSIGVWFMIFWRFGGKGSVSSFIYQWMYDEGVCRTAPPTPDLLIIFMYFPYTILAVVTDIATVQCYWGYVRMLWSVNRDVRAFDILSIFFRTTEISRETISPWNMNMKYYPTFNKEERAKKTLLMFYISLCRPNE